MKSSSSGLRDSRRILVLGRTGSGKTTLARELAGRLGVPHVELDSLSFGPDLETVPLPVLRERTAAAVAGDRWVVDGNKSAVRDLVWPRADTVVWLDYPLVVSLARLGGRAVRRTRAVTGRGEGAGGRAGRSTELLRAARGVVTALRSHAGQRRGYPRLFAAPENQHLQVIRLRGPGETRRWLEQACDG